MTLWFEILCAIGAAGLMLPAYRCRERQRTLKRRSAALQTLYDVGRTMTSTLDFEDLLQQIMTLSMSTIGAETASVVLADDDTHELVLVCSHGLPENVKPGMRSPSDRGVAGWVYHHGEPVMLHGSAINDPRFQTHGGRSHIRSAVSVPLVGKGGPVGVLSLNNSTRHETFTQEDLELLTSIGAQAGIAVQNARLHQQVEEANSQLTMTVEHLRNLKSSLISMTAPELDDALETMLDAAVEGTGAQGGSLTILDQNTIHQIEACYDGKGLILPESGDPTISFITATSAELNSATEHAAHSIVRVLTAEERVTGLLKLMADPNGPGFNEDDKEFVDALVEHASIVVFNNLLYQQAQSGREALERAYKDLQEKQDQLVQSEKLAAVGKLAAWVCHEINNPLGGISGCAQLMQRKIRADESLPGSEMYLRYLSTIVSETERCARITGDLLQFARQQEPRFAEADLHGILSHAVSLIQYKYTNGLTVSTDFDPSVPQLVADSQQLTQVFLNLMTNAAQVMSDGGLLAVSTRYLPEGSERGGYVRVEVRDSGPGISEEDAARLFDPFFTTKETGTGLGLTISKNIVERHRGSLRLEGVAEGGALATVILPMNATNAPRVPLGPGAEHGDAAVATDG